MLGAVPGPPRVVAGGNFATPWRALEVLDAAIAEYRLFMLNAQAGVPDRDGVTLETPFVGPGMRDRERPSWHPKADVSTVVPRLTGPVTSFQHSYIVSEQGTAAIWGHDASAQAEQIITQVAHSRVRDSLREAGRALGFRV